MTSSVQAEFFNLETVVKNQAGFVVPCYQRPYVWSGEDALKLFDDIKRAYRDGQPHYFIGSVLATRQQGSNSRDDPAFRYELIDGQQRITTLMLICLAMLKEGVEELKGVVVLHGKPRLEFDIRPAVSQLLGSHAELEGYGEPGQHEKANNAYLRHLDANLKTLRENVSGMKKSADDSSGRSADEEPIDDIPDFCNYLYRNVRWLNNEISNYLDLNGLFYSLNMGGIQLQPADLLKSKLLRRLNDQQEVYGKIWEACENTKNYFERNLRKIFKDEINGFSYEELKVCPASLLLQHSGAADMAEACADQTRGMTIAEIASSNLAVPQTGKSESKSTETTKDDAEALVYCRSIISFDLLLIHALRIFSCLAPDTGLSDVEPRIKGSNLLRSFEGLLQKDSAIIKRFIETLWRVRYQFDRWVVKWVRRDGEADETLGLTSVSGEALKRDNRTIDDLVQLQAVRNFTGERSAQYWLTPFLGWLVTTSLTGNYEEVKPRVLRQLELIDNKLSLILLSSDDNDMTQKQASYALLCGQPVSQVPVENLISYLNTSRGTGFGHYWFQKLEYLLWRDMSPTKGTKDYNKFIEYRITSKNSVEHVHPQHPRQGSELAQKVLDDFGNLALLSPGQNSSYSDKPVNVKKSEFNEKSTYDSLKLKRIFDSCGDHSRWDPVAIREHRDEMINLLKSHYQVDTSRDSGEFYAAQAES